MNRLLALILAGVLLVLSEINPGARMVTSAAQQPSNFALLVGSSAKLECFTGTRLNFVMWSFAVAGSPTLVTITAWDGTKCTPSSSFPQYRFNTTDSALGQCDLIIDSVTPSQAGWYQCAGSQQVGGSYAFNAQVTVLYSSPRCSQNVTADVAASDAVSMKCDVSYSISGANVDMVWSACRYQTLSSDSIVNGNVTTKVHEIVTVAQSGDSVLSTCRCNSTTMDPPLPPFAGGITSTTNVRYSYVWTSQSNIPVQDCPTSVEMYPPSSEDLRPGAGVNCSASGYPQPICSLYIREPGGTVNVVNGSYAVLATPGVYEVICEAASIITSGQQGEVWCIRATLPHVYNVVGPTTEVAEFESTTKTSDAPAVTTWTTSTTRFTTNFVFTAEETSETPRSSTTRFTTELSTSSKPSFSTNVFISDSPTEIETTDSRADTTVPSTIWRTSAPGTTATTGTTASASTTAPSTTATISSTSATATSSTQLTTVPSSAPKLYPAPYVLVANAGAMNASYAISPDCSNSISSDFRSSFQDIVSRMNSAIASGQLCTDSGGAMTVMPGQIQNYFLGSQIQTQFNLLVGTNPAESLTVGMGESCSWDASQFVQNINNWRQPIISNIFNCPAVDVTPPGFTWQSSQWGCF